MFTLAYKDSFSLAAAIPFPSHLVYINSGSLGALL